MKKINKRKSHKKVKTSGFGISKGIGPFTKESKFVGQLEKNDMI